MLILSIATGSLVGFVGSLFHLLTQRLFMLRAEKIAFLPYADELGWLYSIIVSSVMVGLAVFLVKRFAKEAGGSGVQEIEGALENKREIRWKRVLPVKFFGGLLSLSSGLELGREGPTIQMGGALGRMMSSIFNLTDDDIKTLISAGAGAGLTAAFNAPLAGIIFVVEEMRKQFKYNYLSVASVTISCLSADIVLIMMVGSGVDIEIGLLPVPDVASLWIFIIFGAFFGVLGVIFNKYLIVVSDFFTSKNDKTHYILALLVGGLFGVLVWHFPDYGGGGYIAIPKALSLELGIHTLFILFIARFVLTLFSYGVGAPGGIFAPMISIGVIFGMWFGHFASAMFPGMIEYPAVFAIAGMGALFSATVRAPITGVILVVEMTRNYEQILPLMLTSIVAAIVASELGGKPIYSVLLKRTLDIKKYGKEEYYRMKQGEKSCDIKKVREESKDSSRENSEEIRLEA